MQRLFAIAKEEHSNIFKLSRLPVINSNSIRLLSMSQPIFMKHHNPTRNYSIFSQDKASSTNSMNDQIINQGYNPNMYAENIKKKTAQGKALAEKVGKEVEPNRFLKQQRFEIFLSKMEQLYRNEMNFIKKKKKTLNHMKQSSFYSQQPLKDILKGYNELCTRGLDAEVITESLQILETSLKGRGNKPRTFNDYTTQEMDQSWRMQKLCDDLKFGLQKSETTLTPFYMGKIFNLLGDIGYKNSELIELEIGKLEQLVNEYQQKKNGDLNINEYNFEKAVFGGMKNYQQRHYVFQGFQKSPEFKEYLNTLLEWESDKKTFPKKSSRRSNKEVRDIEDSLKHLIDASVNLKESQKEQISSIESLRTQYFQLKETTDKHQFLLQNPYIKYEMEELQEMLVNGGYLNPSEKASIENKLSEEPFEQKMNRAANVFYDYVMHYSPDLLSPQFDQFYKASTENKVENNSNRIADENNRINLSSLSLSLIGIQKQTFSYRNDVVKKDYLNSFYSQYLHPHDKYIDKQNKNVFESETVRMEREYLRPWTVLKNNIFKFIPLINTMVSDEKENLEGQLNALLALGMCKVESKEVRERIMNNSLVVIQKQLNEVGRIKIDFKTIQNGLMGLAMNPYSNYNTSDLGRILVKSIKNVDNLSFNEELNLLWSLCALGLYDNPVSRQLVKSLNKLPFERLDNELTFAQLELIIDISNSLKIESPSDLKLSNPGLDVLLNSKDLTKQRYQEHNLYDPFKDRVLMALSKGLQSASIQHQMISMSDIFEQSRQDINNLNFFTTPYKPDIIMGYNGHKIGVFVLSERNIMIDTNNADGATLFRMRLLEKEQQGNIKAFSVPVNKVIEYDIEKLKISLNEEFSLQKEIQQQLSAKLPNEMSNLTDAFINFNSVTMRAMSDLEKYSSDLEIKSDLQKIEQFIKQVQHLYSVRQQSLLRYDVHQLSQSIEEVKFNLMKLSLIYETLPQRIQKVLDDKNTTFKQMLLKTKDSLVVNKQEDVQSEVDSNWIGTRYTTEMPLLSSDQIKKSLVPEIINQRFMYIDDYFHYDDWRVKQQQTFDNFNLLVVPHNEKQIKLFYDRDNHLRRVPIGIFPNPVNKRAPLVPKMNEFAMVHGSQSRDGLSGHDEFVQFEKDPYKLMVLKELQKVKNPISNEVGFITNLQNLKQGLKSDYSDAEILKIILLNSNYTELLIEEHLGGSQVKESPLFIERNERHYREFVKNTYLSKDKEDLFTEFYLKESEKKEKILRLQRANEEDEKQEMKNSDKMEKAEKKKEQRMNLIERMLMENDRENQDLKSLSTSLKSHVNINYDMNSLMKSEFIYDVDPDLTDSSISDLQFLNLQRRRSETKLIKSKLIYKLSESISLTDLEKSYLKKWMQDITLGENRNLINLRDSMLPETSSKLSINDIDGKSLYSLNTISRVQIDRDLHGSFSLNDLILEQSHFLDDDLVNKVETELFSARIQQEWGLSKDFKLVETRNKEIGMVMNELEEMLFRAAGMFSEKDLGYIQKMLTISRNKDDFDKVFYELDMKSLKEFMNEANYYDQRIDYLQEWIDRKESEFKSRVILPPQNMRKSDSQLYSELESQYRPVRESLVSKLLSSDQHGNAIDKKYNDLTSAELSTIAENIAVRLYMFNYEYPEFLAQVVKGVMEHPNMKESEKKHLEMYCKMFEMDWRGDGKNSNREEFMAFRPIYLQGTNIKGYKDLDQEGVKSMLKQACAPYLNDIAQKLSQYK